MIARSEERTLVKDRRSRRREAMDTGRGSTGEPLGATAVLIARVKAGDLAAREDLLRRHLLLLSRWARGRVPPNARGLVETDDLVQVAVIRALRHLDHFGSTREGAFLAYLRRTFINLLRNEIRRCANAPQEPIHEHLTQESAPPLDRMIGRQVLGSYEAALDELPEIWREAVIMKLEFGFRHSQIAEAIGSPSSDAARMMISRALVRLAERMGERR